MSLPRRFPRSRPSPAGAPLRSAALTRVSLRGFWSSSLIGGQKRAGFCPLDKLHTSVPGLSQHLQCSTPHAVVSFENSFPAGRHGAVRAGRRAGSFRRRTSRRAPVKPPSRGGSLGLASTLSSSMSAASATCTFRTCSWMKCAHGFAAPPRCVFLWLAIDPRTKLVPVLHLGPRTQHAAHLLIHSLRQLLAPGCLTLFTSDGLNLYFYAALRSLWSMAPSGSARAEGASVAGGSKPDLWSGEEKLTFGGGWFGSRT